MCIPRVRALLVAAGIALTGIAAAGCTDDGPVTAPGARQTAPATPANAAAATWTAEMVRLFELTPANTFPLYVPPAQVVAPGYYVWDSWPLRTRDGSIARVNGYYVMVSLTSRDTVPPGARTPLATWRYFVSQTGSDWRLAGEVFAASNPVGRAQWAGSMMYDEATGLVHAFYTAISGTPVTELDGAERTIQRIAMGTADLVATPDGPAFRNWRNHRVILEPDGVYYELPRNADTVGVVYAYRDPFYYRDPQTGRDHILFTANEAGETPVLNGVVGVAVAAGAALDDWRNLPPLIKAPGVNAQLERPHVVATNGRTYLFWCTHYFTFGAGLTGYEGLYGFAAPGLFGPYQPLNGTGLVAANAPVVYAQTYSFFALPAGPGRAEITSFLNNVGGRAWLTFAPTVGIALDGLNTRIVSGKPSGPFRLESVTSRAVTLPVAVPVTAGR